jgi:pilus assembly protein FimV
MTRTEEPELDVLQNIADQLPAQTDNVVAESEALGKLDLARAYIEIDELKDAQSLLKEVLSVGNDAEREEANTLLEQLKQLK